MEGFCKSNKENENSALLTLSDSNPSKVQTFERKQEWETGATARAEGDSQRRQGHGASPGILRSELCKKREGVQIEPLSALSVADSC